MDTYGTIEKQPGIMDYLETQEQFEKIIGRLPSDEPVPTSVVIQFSATWCGPCRRINTEAMIMNTPKQITWLKCDVDMNSYTAGFCGIKSIPSFMAIHDKKIIGQLQSSDTGKIVAWVNDLYTKSK